ncbi:DUF4360 domain-containing protein [Pseudobacteriovorax antillogorgiicola]|uniref:DUF4360 domain-containing protein n=1 Tax=Pseudobacteriovorax antillogorgiicola TaxID=1513793 RepID=A0A1Y6CJW1_9BACT|nr:DUF4360 domain-containing protein [Pseudobacteriovorax antillogorgiicola]TCS45912.1 uncharacterized protein DUF4360 [Pseudobacteriovorax antillogorgiicola]SMF71079.1 protein of unknown function [Pseudobacteriovorax antillogorgiicola]
MKLCKLLMIASAALTFTTSALAQPDYVRVKDITYNGSGCPVGSADLYFQDGNFQSFFMQLDDYYAEAGEGISLRDSRKNCQLSFKLEFPQGWTYAIGSMTYSGFAHLERNVVAKQQASYYFTGEAEQATIRTEFEGPMHRNFWLTDSAQALIYAPCKSEAILNVNSSVQVRSLNRHNYGAIGLDNLRGSLVSFNFNWKRCS